MTLGFFVSMALLGLGSWGWGQTLLVLFARLGWTDVWEEISSPLSAVLGMALFVSVFGLLIAAHVALFALMIAWHILGTALLLFIRAKRSQGHPRRELRLWARNSIFGCIVALLSISALSYPIAGMRYNINDDDAAYLYLAKRLLTTHTLIDPFSQRRLVSFGGSTLFQSFILGFAGDSTLETFEYVFCLILIWFLVIRTLHRRWLTIGSAAVGASLIFLHGVGPIANTSPSFSGALFTLAILQLCALVKEGSVIRERLLLGTIGLLFGALLTLRIYFGVAVAVILISYLFLRSKEIARKSSLLLIPAITVAVLIGWSISSFEATRAWFFPIFDGNYIKSFPGSSDPHISLAALAHRLGNVLLFGGFGNLLIATFILGLLLRLTSTRHKGVGEILMIASSATFLQLIIFTKLQSGAAIADMERFSAPTCLALGLFAFDSMWPTLNSPSPPLLRGVSLSLQKSKSPYPFIGELFRIYWPAVAAIPILTVITWATFGLQTSMFYWTNFTGALRSGTDVITGSIGLRERYGVYYLSEYKGINSLIPAHSHVLAAVDFPYLLDMSKYDVATLDIVGNVSPQPGMPLTSPPALASYLRDLGITYIIADNPKEFGLYWISQWRSDLTSTVYEYRVWAPYFIRWDRLIQRMEHSKNFTTQSSGYLTLISLSAFK